MNADGTDPINRTENSAYDDFPDWQSLQNQPPVANAGSDQTVNEGDPVILDGSTSFDPDNGPEPLSFTWTQVAGLPFVTLTGGNTATSTFVAPFVPVGGTTLTFELIVDDGRLISYDQVNITIKNVNHPPVADAGADQIVQEGSPVTLDGSASYDPDGAEETATLTYNWIRIAGPPVVLANSNTSQPSFTAPFVGAAGATLTFELTVSDISHAIATDTVDVVVENVNHSPVANAGADQTKDEGNLVMLNGSASNDPDGDTLNFIWTRISGTPVVLSGANTVTPTFLAPQQPSHSQETLIFQLVVDDGLGGTASSQVAITVLDVDAPPVCNLAQASPALLWSPNHTLISVGIVGLADPDNDQVVVTITGVVQDEPVHGLGDGDTSPDAVIQGDKVLLRAERIGYGNGRVYQVTFNADDGFGGNCTGTIAVCVPHDRRAATCVKDGLSYNSTIP
jgi:hypothetical protein